MIRKSKKIYKNGLRLVVLDGFSSNSVTIAGFVGAGFRDDPKEFPGLAHFVEHCLFNGTKTFHGPKEVAQAVEQYGGWHDAYTWIDYQKHVVHVPKDRLDPGMQLLFETIASPVVADEEIKMERNVVTEEILLNKSDPYKAVWDYVFNPIYFQGTNLSRPYSGSVKNIDSIRKEDVLGFIESFFTPQNTVILVAGDVDPRNIEEKIGLLNEDFNREKLLKENEIELSLKNRFKIHSDNSYYQTVIMCGVKTVPYDSEEKNAIEILQSILGGGYGSSIVQQLRESGGLTYGWYSTSDFIKESGYSVFITGCSHENVENVASVVIDQYRRIGEGKIDEKEFKQAKGYIAGSLLANTETGLNYIDWYGRQELLFPDRSLSIQDKIKIYEKISLDEAINVGKKYFTEKNIFFGGIGDIKDSLLKKVF